MANAHGIRYHAAMTTPFDPTAYGPVFAPLLETASLPPLGPGKPNRGVEARLRQLDLARAFAPHMIKDHAASQACLSGLWLLHNFLDESHTVSQSLHTAEGSFWHAIMHRREPDPGNSKYWWRRVGSHPVLQQLAERSASVGYHFTDPYAFVDFVEQVRDTNTTDEETARRGQQLEWELLFDWCFHQAVSG